MNISSQPTNYSDILTDTITIPVTSTFDFSSLGNVTTSTGSINYTYSSGTASTITLTSGATGTYTIDSSGNVGIGSTYPTFYRVGEEFVDFFPDIERVKKMCETYPGLKIAYEKFLTTYRLVKDDYDNPNTKK